MKKVLIVSLFMLVFLAMLNQLISAKTRFLSPPNNLELVDDCQRDSLILEILKGWMNFIRVTTANTCLPINEASESELVSGNFSSDFFVPAQLGYKIMAEILSYEVREQFSDFTAGFTKDELLISLNCMLDALEGILEEYAYVHPETGKKALYQVHLTNGEAPLNSDFDKIVSMLDNVYLITALEMGFNWAKEEDGMLADRISAVLGEFDLGMWIRDSKTIHLGAPEDPLNGGRLDRILSEGRLAPVLALARGEISSESFQEVINMLRWSSLSGAFPDNNPIRRLPFFGTALEIWVPTAILSVELETVLGCESLYPLVDAWEEARLLISNLPAAGFSGIGDGFGGFLECSIQPSESPANNQNKPLLVVPAALMQAGAMMGSNEQALHNFFQTYCALKENSLLNASWGPPNYIDYGSGQVNTNDYLRGTLEIAQASVALMNTILGGRFIEETLRKDTSWDNAMNQYKELLGTRISEQQAEDPILGTGGVLKTRFPAFGGQSWYLPQVGNYASYEINISSAGNYHMVLRYSNDDLGSGDSLTLAINGQERARMKTIDTGDFGLGWENFVYTDDIDLGFLSAGTDTLSIKLDKTDGFGVELDFFALISRQTRVCDDFQGENPSFECDDMTSIKSEAGILTGARLYPNPSQGEIFVEIPSNINGSLRIKIWSLLGQLHQSIEFAAVRPDNKLRLNLDGLPPGPYIVEVSTGRFVKSLKLSIVK